LSLFVLFTLSLPLIERYWSPHTRREGRRWWQEVWFKPYNLRQPLVYPGRGPGDGRHVIFGDKPPPQVPTVTFSSQNQQLTVRP
jgi:hypothetical protein